MASAPRDRLRLFLDASILIKAASFPRLPFEIVRLGMRGEVGIVLSPLVIGSAAHHVESKYPDQLELLRRVLHRLQHELVADPGPERVAAERDLCRDESDVPVALAAIDAGVDYLVTTDRDLTVLDQTTARLRERVQVITPLALVRYVLKWPEAQIQARIHRQWRELTGEEWQELEIDPGGSRSVP